MPLARIAVISLSEARRLRPEQNADQHGHRNGVGKALGSVYAKMRKTWPSEADSRTTSSRILPRSRMNSTKVKSAPPSRA